MADTEHPDEGSNSNTTDPDELRRRLRLLMGDDALAYIDLELPTQPGPDEARERHNARTARYKHDQALQLAPDSEAVRQATSNVLMRLLLANDADSPDLFRRAMQELIDAGYDQEEGRASLLRLLTTYKERRRAWQTRTRQKLARAVVKQLRELDQ